MDAHRYIPDSSSSSIFPGGCSFGSANLWAAQLQQVLSLDIVEGLDHGTVQQLRNPSAFRFDCLDTTVALLRVIIAGIHDDDRIGRCREQIARQLCNLSFT